jgi:hypothetical protein
VIIIYYLNKLRKIEYVTTKDITINYTLQISLKHTK